METREIILDILQEMHEDIDYEKEKALVTDKILDSFDLVSLVSELTDAFDIEITAKDFVEENFNSLDTLVTKTGRRYAFYIICIYCIYRCRIFSVLSDSTQMAVAVSSDNQHWLLCIGRNFLSHLFTCKFGGDLSGRTVDRKKPKTGKNLHPGKCRPVCIAAGEKGV